MTFDRTVHCTIVPPGGGRIEFVRYDRAGKYFLEDGARRKRLSLREAAAFVDERESVVWHEGMPGGSAFDREVRRQRETKNA